MPLKYASYPQISPSVTQVALPSAFHLPASYVLECTWRRTVDNTFRCSLRHTSKLIPPRLIFCPFLDPATGKNWLSIISTSALALTFPCSPLQPTSSYLLLGTCFPRCARTSWFCLRVPSRAECYFAWSRGGKCVCGTKNQRDCISHKITTRQRHSLTILPVEQHSLGIPPNEPGQALYRLDIWIST